MRAGKPSPSDSRRRGLRVVSLLLVAAALAGCYRNPDPTEYSAAAKKNFVAACTTAVSANKGTTTTTIIADKDTCGCIYDKISDKNSADYITWDDLKSYEDEQSKAKAGELPTPPKHLTKAIDACKKQGPVVQG